MPRVPSGSPCVSSPSLGRSEPCCRLFPTANWRKDARSLRGMLPPAPGLTAGSSSGSSWAPALRWWLQSCPCTRACYVSSVVSSCDPMVWSAGPSHMDSPGERTGGPLPSRGWSGCPRRRRPPLRRREDAARWGHLVAESAAVSPAALTPRPGGWKRRASGSPEAILLTPRARTTPANADWLPTPT